MTDKKTTELPEITTLVETDLLMVVRPGDPAGTKNKKVKIQNSLHKQNEYAELSDVVAPYANAGALSRVNDTPDGMVESTTKLSEPAADQFTLTRGTSALAVQTSATINQDLSSTSDVTFNTVTTEGLKDAKITVSTDIKDLMNNPNLYGDPATAFIITDAGSANVNTSAGRLYIRDTNSPVGDIRSYNYAGQTNVPVPNDNTTNWAYIDYNAGSPQLAFVTSLASINLNTQLVVGRVYRSGTTLTIFNVGQKFSNYYTDACRKDFEVYNAQRASGLIIGEKGTRNIEVSLGILYCAHNRVPIAGIDTSVSDTFDVWNSSASVSPDATGQTQYDNNQYWDGGALQPLTTNRYGTRFFYVDFGGNLHMQYGTSNSVSLAGASAELLPAKPAYLRDFAIYIGSVIIQKGAAAAAEPPSSAFESTVAGTPVTKHDDLSNVDDAGVGVAKGHITNAAQSIAGLKTFLQLLNYATHPSILNDTDIIDKKYYVDNLPAEGYDEFIATPGQVLFVITTGTPISPTLAKLTVNGNTKQYGASNDFTISGTNITWYNNTYTFVGGEVVQIWYDKTSYPPGGATLEENITDHNSNYNGYRCRSIAGSGANTFSFIPPPNISGAPISVKLVTSPSSGAAGSGKDIDFTLTYAAQSESLTTNVVIDSTSTYNLGTLDVFTFIDLTTLFSGVRAGDTCGLFVDHKGIGGANYYYKIIWQYATI